MKKHKIIITLAVVALTLCCVVVGYLNSNYRYSKLLVDAIADEDKSRVMEILEKKPSCVNTYPTLEPMWWQALMNYAIHYPLVEACSTGNIEMVKILVENGADINLGAGFTPLAMTYSKKPENWYAISLYLLENGASLDYKNEDFTYGNALSDILSSRSGTLFHEKGLEDSTEVNSAFYYALEHCNCEKVDWSMVLQHSVTYDRIEIVAFLIDENYCDVNDKSGDMTALMFAARDSTLEMVQLLLDYGADKSIKDDDGMTAYDYAVEEEKHDIANLLKP